MTLELKCLRVIISLWYLTSIFESTWSLFFLWKLEAALRGLGVFLGSEGGLSGVPEEFSPKSHLPCRKGWIWDSLLLEHPKKKLCVVRWVMMSRVLSGPSFQVLMQMPGMKLATSLAFPKISEELHRRNHGKTLTSKAWHSHTVGRVLDRQNKTWG